MTLKHNLARLRDFLFDPNNWTQYASARNQAGENCDPHLPQARKWCLHGAILRLFPGPHNPHSKELQQHLDARAREEGFVCFVDLNDETSHDYVIGFLDRAAA